MSGIPHTWRLAVNNQSGQNISVTVTARFGKFASDGSITYSAEQTVFTGSGIASNSTGWTSGATQSNATNQWLWADLSIAITPAISTPLNVAIQIEGSTDGGTTWAASGRGRFVAACTTSSNAPTTPATVFTRQIR